VWSLYDPLDQGDIGVTGSYVGVHRYSFERLHKHCLSDILDLSSFFTELHRSITCIVTHLFSLFSFVISSLHYNDDHDPYLHFTLGLGGYLLIFPKHFVWENIKYSFRFGTTCMQDIFWGLAGCAGMGGFSSSTKAIVEAKARGMHEWRPVSLSFTPLACSYSTAFLVGGLSSGTVFIGQRKIPDTDEPVCIASIEMIPTSFAFQRIRRLQRNIHTHHSSLRTLVSTHYAHCRSCPRTERSWTSLHLKCKHRECRATCRLQCPLPRCIANPIDVASFPLPAPPSARDSARSPPFF
jgi:hypothetical protein